MKNIIKHAHPNRLAFPFIEDKIGWGVFIGSVAAMATLFLIAWIQ